jgi:hypothetical protein
MAHHILGDENGVKNFTVVNQKRMAHKVRRNHRAARPGFDRPFGAALIHLLDFFNELGLNERTFLQ